MITQDTAGAIWNAYREIEAGHKLLADMEQVRKRYEADHDAATLADAFGRRQHLHLGIPSGDASHRLLRVSPEIAESVIKAHIAEKEAELEKVNQRAKLELIQNRD